MLPPPALTPKGPAHHVARGIACFMGTPPFAAIGTGWETEPHVC